MSEAKRNLTKNQTQWDRKKIIFFSILILVLLILGYRLKDSILGKSYNLPAVSQKAKAISTPVDVGKNVSDQINNLKEEAGNINLVDVATSSPQVQKVINDLKALKDYPNNQLKQACMNICGKL